jgi:hypothetical protein
MGILERQQQRDIDGVVYIVNPLPFGIGKKALLRFTKIAGPVLAAAVGKDGAAGAIAAIVGALTDVDLDYFASTFGNASWYVDGEKNVPLVTNNQADHFDGRYEAFFEWLAFSVEVNFRPFFSAMAKRLNDATAIKAKATSPSAERTG